MGVKYLPDRSAQVDNHNSQIAKRQTQTEQRLEHLFSYHDKLKLSHRTGSPSRPQLDDFQVERSAAVAVVSNSG